VSSADYVPCLGIIGLFAAICDDYCGLTLVRYSWRCGDQGFFRNVHIYILYIKSPGLPITRGSPGRTVQSGRAGPHPDVYKTGSGVLGFSFLRSTPIH
jgi:hypothetical protein